MTNAIRPEGMLTQRLGDVSSNRFQFANKRPEDDYLSRSSFLGSLYSKVSGKYKRYGGLPLRYPGGKSLAVGHVLEHFPDGITSLASPFCGGGSIEIACARELGIRTHAYDVFDILVNFWQVLLENSQGLAETLDRFEPTKEQYAKRKARLKKHWDGTSMMKNEKLLAANYWFNHNLSYGPGFLGWMSSMYACPDRYRRLVDKLRNFDCPLLSVEADGFDKSIPYHNGTFLYCDPPYYLEEGKMFKGIYPQRNFPVHHKGFNHYLLAEMLKDHEGGFVLSYNDCKTIRDLYSGYKIVDVKWQYTLGQGETRIGKNRINAGTSHVKQSHEILVVHHG